MPSELVFGFETEWMNFSADADPDSVAECALQALKQRMPHLPFGGGIFLANSFRCYVDCRHLETASCEVSNPLDLVACIKAMERILLSISEPASRLLGPNSAIKFGRANIDPSSFETYGQHESYLTEHSPEFYTQYLVPFLVTRPVWSGAGGLAPNSSSVTFAVAPRLLLFSNVTDGGTTSHRPIVTLRDESLAKAGNYRLHIIAGETLSSQLGLYLKAGVTALVVRAAELGAQIGFEICKPITSMHVVARDPSCKKPIPLSDGRRLTAIEIQSEYLASVEKYLPELPAWAPAICRRWRTVLAALDEDPSLLSRTLDWPIKYNIFRSNVKQLEHQVDGKDLLAELREAAADTVYRNTAPTLELLLGPSSPVLGKVAELNAILRAHGLRWTEVKSSAEGRARLAEILDIRYGMLGEGIFDTLDRDGLLQHRVVEEEAIERARNEAPAGTRARLRSQAIRELAGRSGAGCSWELVVDGQGRVLDLSDPREQSAQWRTPDNSKTAVAREIPEELRFLRASPPTHDEIAHLAYQYWRMRGCPQGSPEVDWEHAEWELREQYERRAYILRRLHSL